MSSTPDLSLPAKAPSMACYRGQAMTSCAAALYSLVELTDAELEDLQRGCEAGCVETGSEPGANVRPAPQPLFVSQPLRAVFDYHLELGRQDEFNPRYFLVAVEKDWQKRGVILVTLDDDDLDCNVDSFRIKAVDAGLSLVNLQIGNSSWVEEREGCEIHECNVFESQVKRRNDDGDDHDGGNDGPPAPTKNVPLGYYVPIYTTSSLSHDEVISRLEPAFKVKSPEDFICRIQAQLEVESSTSDKASTQDLIRQAATLHPQRCAKNPYLLKHYLLVIDTDDPVENGMVIVKFPPPNESSSEVTRRVDSRHIDELAAATFQHIRIPYSCHEGLQTRFLTLANGDAEWPSDSVRAQSVFIVFQYNTYGEELGFGSSLIDSNAARRKPGEERVVYAPEVVKSSTQRTERLEWSYEEAVKRFPWLCREKRFIEGLEKTFFMCVDGNDVAKTGLLLVRRRWNGDVWSVPPDQLLSLPAEGVKGVRVPIKDALVLLEKGLRGEIGGMSKSLRDFFL